MIARLLLIAATAASLSAQAEVKTLDRVVAVVNKGVITERELDERITAIRANLTRQKINAPPVDVLRSQVLERMINELVQLQFANDTGLKIDDAQLERSMQRIAEANKLTMPEFRTTLTRQGMSYEQFREEIRREMLLTRLKEREIESKIYITESEVDAFMKSQQDSAEAETEFHLNHILVQVPEQAKPDEIERRRKKAESALAEIAKGKPFAEVAASLSDAADALSGGDLGWRSAGRLPPLITEAISKLKPGQNTQILKSANGFHIIRLVEKRERSNREVIQQTHARHILVKVNEVTSDSEARQKIQQLRDRALSGGKFDELAKLHSEDGSATKGGDLDWLSPGDTVPEFESAMTQLKPGDISEPVRTQFGWHLIQVIERRTQDVTVEKERLRVRMELRARKADEQQEDWVTQLRDRAFVDVRLIEK
ncbi:peptidylprolyl isomerase [Parachitinimonas caeni]|uniref:Chaperone SurA n=1 Tax=Parachitinimonas caeni TaxID=3031301 RepID=A0ABT7DRA3_9NEIS|nr:peptidylprolyl isomerase [Parachitinimonas caeni]MDK2122489.1 peptidylprolyl isomerase [Parachitinimonas caeni]